MNATKSHRNLVIPNNYRKNSLSHWIANPYLTTLGIDFIEFHAKRSQKSIARFYKVHLCRKMIRHLISAAILQIILS